MISDRFAQRHFAGRDAVGARVVLNRRPYTVIGVMPAWFEFPKRGAEFNGEPADVYLPLHVHARASGRRVACSTATASSDGCGAACRPNRRPRTPRRWRRGFVENYPPAMREMGYSLQIIATPLLDELAGSVRRPLLILLGAVGLVLLVACANVANVIMSRQMARQREIGVRVAMGAARRRLFQMLLTENLILAFAGGVAGLVIGQWAVRTVPAVIASSLPGVSDVALDARVIGFTFVLSLITAVVFGLAPLAVERPGRRERGAARRHPCDRRTRAAETAGGFRRVERRAGIRAAHRRRAADPQLRESHGRRSRAARIERPQLRDHAAVHRLQRRPPDA